MISLTTAVILVAFITLGCLVCWEISAVFWLLRALDMHIFSFIGMSQPQILDELTTTFYRQQTSVFARLIAYMRKEYREHPEEFDSDDGQDIWKDLERPDSHVAGIAFRAERHLFISWRGIRFQRLEHLDVAIEAPDSEGLDVHWHLDDLPDELQTDFLNLWHLTKAFGFLKREAEGR